MKLLPMFALLSFCSVAQNIYRVEAEDFTQQRESTTRKWIVISEGVEAEKANGGQFVQCLPDTRKTHDDKLIAGENFSNKAGQMAILSYNVDIEEAGKYYVWVRSYSTGSEDNGIHVGLNGTWPESGQRMQWCEGKNQWTWASKQRTAEQHCGVPFQIFLEIEKPGMQTIEFSMREDGFRFDGFVLTKDKNFDPNNL